MTMPIESTKILYKRANIRIQLCKPVLIIQANILTCYVFVRVIFCVASNGFHNKRMLWFEYWSNGSCTWTVVPLKNSCPSVGHVGQYFHIKNTRTSS